MLTARRLFPLLRRALTVNLFLRASCDPQDLKVNRHAIPEFFDKFPILNQEFFKESSYASNIGLGSYFSFIISLDAPRLCLNFPFLIPKLMADPDKFLSFGQIMSGSAGHLLPYLDR